MAQLWLRALVPASLILLVSQAAGSQQIAIPPLDVPPITAGLTPPPPSRRPNVVYAASDIAQCASIEKAHRTGALMQELLEASPGSIGILPGDVSNDHQGFEKTYDCLHETPWGAIRHRLKAVPGNHDYLAEDPLFSHLYTWLPSSRGDSGLGYYSFDYAGWHLIALNTELPEARRQAQLDWLRADMKRNPVECTLAYFHRPPYSSGKFGSPRARPLFAELYRQGADLVVTGHEHFFAAFPPLDDRGTPEAPFGVPMLIVGTGGADLFPWPNGRRHQKMILAQVLGVTEITLQPKGFSWRFIATDRTVPRVGGDKPVSGEGRCHGRPPAVVAAE